MTKLRRAYALSDQQKKLVGIGDAVEISLCPSRDGVAESAMEHANNTAGLLGTLIELLEEKDVLRASDVIRMLGGDWEVVE